MDLKDVSDLSMCIWNLEVIGSIQHGQRLDCTSKVASKLSNTGWAQMCRILYRDSRHSTIQWLQQVGYSLLRLTHLEAVLSSADTKTCLIQSILRAVLGVRNLIALYSDDTSVVAQLQHILHAMFNLSLNILHTTSDSMIDYTGNDDNFARLTSLYTVTLVDQGTSQQTKLDVPAGDRVEEKNT